MRLAPHAHGSSVPVFTVPRITTGDPTGAIKLIAARHDHGTKDDLPEPLIAEIAVKRKVETTCGYVANWAIQTLRAAGYTARVVQTLTLDRWIPGDNGHDLVEAMTPRGWVVYDVDLDLWFWRDSRPMSFIELVDAVTADQPYQIRRLSGTHSVPTDLRDRFRRLIQVPMIRRHGLYWFVSSQSERIMSYSDNFRPLSHDAWIEQFYGSNESASGARATANNARSRA